MRFIIMGIIVMFFLVTVGGFVAFAYKEHREKQALKPKKMSPREIKEQKQQEIDRVLRKAIKADLASDNISSVTSVKHDVIDVLGSLDDEMASYTQKQYENILEEEMRAYRQHERSSQVLDKIDTHRSMLRQLRAGKQID